MSQERHYATPLALRRALTDHLRAVAKTSRWTLPQLQRQIAYDRLLERLYRVDNSWIVKGATALLARGLSSRTTLDIDLYRTAPLDISEADVREAAALDIGDWFRFEVGGHQVLRSDVGGLRLPVRSYIGTTQWVAFRVDLVGSDLRMTGAPEEVPALARVVLPDVVQHGYRVYPLVDHVADKIAATLQSYGERQAPSTRFKDLVDLVAIIRGASVDAKAQVAALASEVARRNIELPSRFFAPNRAVWEPGYAAEVARLSGDLPRTLEDALDFVRPFIDPLLDGSASGVWNPREHRWVESG